MGENLIQIVALLLIGLAIFGIMYIFWAAIRAILVSIIRDGVAAGIAMSSQTARPMPPVSVPGPPPKPKVDPMADYHQRVLELNKGRM